MSNVFPFERLFDTAATIERRAREEKQDLAGTRKRDDDPPRMRCRLCGYESAEVDFCPECVAYTMVKVTR